ncbi:unnamed protein product [Penicillium salamii]|nr:unnamed protein product [Penicillium salamii]CAG8411586.1 unnamed protein product [Penicillium salamii]
MATFPDYQLEVLNWAFFLPLLSALVLGSLVVYYIVPSKPAFPSINAQGIFEPTSFKAKRKFVIHANDLIKSGLAKCDIFRLTCDTGIQLVLSQKYLDEIRNHPAFSFQDLIRSQSHFHIKGFEPFGEDGNIILDVARKRLTQAQGSITGPLWSEASVALQEGWADNPGRVSDQSQALEPFQGCFKKTKLTETEWHEVALYFSIQRLVARLSCKIFLGDEMCRNEDWLRVITDYARHSIQASDALQLWPKIVRPIVAMCMQSTRMLKKEVQAARSIMKPVLEKRLKNKENALKNGMAPEIHNDATQWMEDVAAGRRYDPALMHLGLALVAIFTTADFFTQALLDLCGKETLISELREEVITVLREDGVKKTAMYKLRLMDSFLKESQRMKPIALTTFQRMAMENVKLADGSEIARGTGLMIPNDRMWDSRFYENPETFDPYRFVRLREVAGHENSFSLISLSPEHMGFGLGRHACPGRFFAVNEVKIALCHVLLKYEFKLAEGTTPQVTRSGIRMQTDISAKVLVRRRQEISLPYLVCESDE